MEEKRALKDMVLDYSGIWDMEAQGERQNIFRDETDTFANRFFFLLVWGGGEREGIREIKIQACMRIRPARGKSRKESLHIANLIVNNHQMHTPHTSTYICLTFMNLCKLTPLQYCLTHSNTPHS